MENLSASRARARRCRLLLLALTAGTLPAWAFSAAGSLAGEIPGLRWVFLLACPVAAGLLLLTAAYGVGLETPAAGRRGGAARSLSLAIGLFTALVAALSLPTLLFPRLPPTIQALVTLSRRPAPALRDLAMGHPDPRRRAEAALGLYLRTGEGALFLAEDGQPALYEPRGREARQLAWPRWLASRPGALPGERRALAAAVAALVVTVLAGLPWVARRARLTAAGGRTPRCSAARPGR